VSCVAASLIAAVFFRFVNIISIVAYLDILRKGAVMQVSQNIKIQLPDGTRPQKA